MKSILSLTDFSNMADYAVEAAFQLSQLYNSDLYIYHSLTSKEIIKVEFGAKPKFSFIDENQANIIKKFEFWNEWADRLEVPTEFITSSDDLLKKTKDLVSRLKPNLLVMGSKGAGAKNQYLWGSNTQKIVQSIDCPVLVVNDRMANYQLDTYIFASTFDEIEQESFKYFLKLMQPQKTAHIHLVFIDTLGYFNQPSAAIQESMVKFKKIASPFETSLHYYKDYSVNAGLRHLMDSIKPDMLVMANKFSKPIKHFFEGSEINRMINHSDFPVLVIN